MVTLSSCPHFSATDPSIENAAPLVILLRSAPGDSSARQAMRWKRPRNASVQGRKLKFK